MVSIPCCCSGTHCSLTYGAAFYCIYFYWLSPVFYHRFIPQGRLSVVTSSLTVGYSWNAGHLVLTLHGKTGSIQLTRIDLFIYGSSGCFLKFLYFEKNVY